MIMSTFKASPNASGMAFSFLSPSLWFEFTLKSTCSFWCFFFSWRLRFRFAPIFFHILYTFHWHGRFCVYLALAGLENYLVSWNISQQYWPCPQIAFPRRGKVALVAFVWLFSTVRFQMSPQTASQRRGKVTLVALVWLFSTVRFQMCPQMVCRRRGIVTLVAFV